MSDAVKGTIVEVCSRREGYYIKYQLASGLIRGFSVVRTEADDEEAIERGAGKQILVMRDRTNLITRADISGRRIVDRTRRHES